MRSILDFIRPPEDADWKSVNRWRWNVTLTLLVLVGGLTWGYGPRGFAGTKDVEQKIKAAVEPIAQKQDEHGRKLDDVAKMVADSLAKGVASEIRLIVAKRCAGGIDAAERERLAAQLDAKQEEYFGYKGFRYPLPSCSEL